MTKAYRWRVAAVVLIACAASIVLTFIVGSDPAVRAYQEVSARGEEVAPERMPAMSENGP